MERTRRGDGIEHRAARFEDLAALNVAYDPFWDGRRDQYDAALKSHARTAIVNGKPAAILGMSPKWKWVSEAWSSIDREAFAGRFGNTRKLIELAKALIEWYQQNHNIRRMEVNVDADDQAALEFACVLGFEQESGRRHGAGPGGKDLVMMVRFWE